MKRSNRVARRIDRCWAAWLVMAATPYEGMGRELNTRSTTFGGKWITRDRQRYVDQTLPTPGMYP